jgi:hypothetical protein
VPANLRADEKFVCPGCKKSLKVPGADRPAATAPIVHAPSVEEVLTVEPIDDEVLDVIPAEEEVLSVVPVEESEAAPDPVPASRRRKGPRARPAGHAKREANQPTPSAAPGRKWPLNGAVVAAAVVAGLTMLSVLGTPLGWLGVEPPGVTWAFWVALPAAVFGGLFAAAAAPNSPGKHSLYAGLYAAVLTLLFAVFMSVIFIVAASGSANGNDESSPSLVPLFLLVVFVPLGYLLGGWLERGITSMARSINPRQRWTYTTQDGLSFPVYGPWRHPFLAAVWKLLGWLFILTCWVHISWDDGKVRGIREVISAIVLGKVCFILAKKRTGTSARDALESDDRPPIVYLRSFQDDGMTKAGWWSTLSDATRLLSKKTLEERLITVLGRYGPVVAIGRPGEDVPELGAARVYVGDDHWKDLITDLLSERGAVALLRAGETQGLRWELRKVGKMLSPGQFLLFLPFALTGTRATRDARYAAFREWANECFPAELPEKIDDVCLFYFDKKPEWKTHVVEKKGAIPLGHPLAPILERIQANKALWPSRFFDWKRDWWLLLILLPIVLGLLALCGLGLFGNSR